MTKNVYDIAVLPGDGIGPEVIDATLPVLHAVTQSVGLELRYSMHASGAALYRDTGEAIDPATMRVIGQADAILLGAMGLPDVRRPDGTEITPQIDIREQYDLFASLRPARLFAGVKPTLNDKDVDMLVIRETTEGLFAGRHEPVWEDDKSVSDRLTITRATSEKLFELAFAQAKARRRVGGRGHVTLLDKSNVLSSFAFLRRIFDEVAARHPDVGTDRLYIDAAAMLMVCDPGRFDVVVTENMFGDIISELAAGIAGGLGLAPSADVGERHAVFQPCHGSAPDLAGCDVANPVATILSAGMMLDWLAEQYDEPRGAEAAVTVRTAVATVLANGPRTPDLGGNATTSTMGNAIVAALPRTTPD